MGIDLDMEKIINELYYMVDAWAGQQYENNEETKGLEEQKFALQAEIARRVGENGQEMLEKLSELSLRLEDIHDQALFRAALRLALEMTQKRALGQSA